MVDEEERVKASGVLNELHMEFGLRKFVVFEGAVTYEAFAAGLLREKEVSRKELALAGVNMVRVVAELLPGGSSVTPLEHLEGMSREELGHFCRTSVAAGVEEVLLRAQQEALQKVGREAEGGGGAEQSNAKFAQGGEELEQATTHLSKGRFGKLKDFTTGLVGKIGLPDPRLMEAMRREHCMRGDSKLPFSPPNYDMTTTPEAEWRVVTDPEEGERVSVDKRHVRPLAVLRQLPTVRTHTPHQAMPSSIKTVEP